MQERLALGGNCCASCWARLWDRPSMSVIAFSCSCLTIRFSLVFSAIFLRDRTSSRNWVVECLSARTWDWRSRTDLDNEFCELVWLLVSSNLNTICLGLSRYLQDVLPSLLQYMLGLSHSLQQTCACHQAYQPETKQRDDRFCTCINKDDNYSVNSIQFQIRK